MGFLTRDQLRELKALAGNVLEAKEKLQRHVLEYDGQNLHSQACPIGGMFYGAHNGISGETPCPCGVYDPSEVTVTIKMRPPRKGERGWEVPIDIEDPLEALHLVVRESGERMLGWNTDVIESTHVTARGMREITIIITDLVEA